jgi:hypothetical protein
MARMGMMVPKGQWARKDILVLRGPWAFQGSMAKMALMDYLVP